MVTLINKRVNCPPTFSPVTYDNEVDKISERKLRERENLMPGEPSRDFL